MRIILAILLLLCGNSFAQENIAEFSDKTVPVLNDSLKSLNDNANKSKNRLDSYFGSDGILSVSAGGTGQDFSAVEQGNIPFFSATGVMGNIGVGTSGYYLKTLGAGADPVWSRVIETYSAGDYLISRPGKYFESYDAGSTYGKVDETYVPRSGTLRIKFWLEFSAGAGGETVYGKIYRNGSPVGTERTRTFLDATMTEYSEDISGWQQGDLVQLYVKDSGNPSNRVSGGNVRIYESAPTKEVVSSIPEIHWGTGVPSGSIGSQGDLYLRTDGGATTTLYVKTGSTTWTAK